MCWCFLKFLMSVPVPVMPIGVEHEEKRARHGHRWLRVPVPVMPIGVEHEFKAPFGPLDYLGARPRDANRR